MAETTARELANGIVAFCNDHGDLITNLKLQKLLYYAQGWYLAFHDRPLFDDPIQAWISGPVVPAVFYAFQKFKWQAINIEPTDLPTFSEQVSEHIREVWTTYGSLSSYDLEISTHREMPWLNARKGLRMDEPSEAIIVIEDMKSYFKSQLARA